MTMVFERYKTRTEWAERYIGTMSSVVGTKGPLFQITDIIRHSDGGTWFRLSNGSSCFKNCPKYVKPKPLV